MAKRDQSSIELLRRMCLTPAISGREHRLRQLIRQHAQGLFDEVSVDPMGSLLCVRKPRSRAGTRSGRGGAPGASGASGARRASGPRPTKVMIAAHMDQIGFMVRHVESSGFVRVQAVGGFDPRNLFARLVTVCPDLEDPSRDLPGVMNPGGRPIHIATDEDKKKVPEVNDLVIDLGLPAEQVKKQVTIGDTVVLRAPFERIGASVVSQCLDNRVACWVALQAVERLEQSKAAHACEVHAAFTVQEEVGLRGAMTAGYAVKPDIAIAVDTTLAVDTPGVPEDQRVTRLGDGAALTVMDGGSIADPDLLETFERLAVDRQIKHQRSILPRGSTDAAAIQRAAAGARAFTLSCPTRYIHTVTEMVHLDDLTACRDLLAAFLEQA